MSYNTLSTRCRAFTFNLVNIKIPKNIHEVVEIPEGKKAVIEEMQALEKNGTWDVMNMPKGKN